jgi:6-phosphogluconolactonase
MSSLRVSTAALIVITLFALNYSATGQTSDISTNETLPAARFVFSTEYANGTVSGFGVDPTTGVLSSTGQAPVWAHWGPTRLAANVGATQLFAANQGSMDGSAYTIDRSNGYLTAVPGANFPTGGVSTGIAVHPSNKFVYVSLYNGWDQVYGGQNGIAAFSIQSDGSLTPVPGSPFVTTYGAWALAISPNGTFLYVSTATASAGAIAVYRINQTTGAIAPIAGSPFTLTPVVCEYCANYEFFEDLAIDPKGKFLFGPGHENGVIYVYSIKSSTGAPKEVPGSP